MSQSILKWVTKKSSNDAASQPNPEETSEMEIVSTQSTAEKITSREELGIPECPNQPLLSFPLRSFGKQQRAFCSSWYNKHKWLHYHEASDTVFAFIAQLLKCVDYL